jgi:hypothetical protein
LQINSYAHGNTHTDANKPDPSAINTGTNTGSQCSTDAITNCAHNLADCRPNGSSDCRADFEPNGAPISPTNSWSYESHNTKPDEESHSQSHHSNYLPNLNADPCT